MSFLEKTLMPKQLQIDKEQNIDLFNKKINCLDKLPSTYTVYSSRYYKTLLPLIIIITFVLMVIFNNEKIFIFCVIIFILTSIYEYIYYPIYAYNKKNKLINNIINIKDINDIRLNKC
jgi:hypothetical protein